MDKRYFITWIVVFVAWLASGMVVHGMLLGPEYAKLSNLFRAPADSQQYFPLMILAHVIVSGAMVWIYARGREARPWAGQGLRFGIAVALLTVVPTYLIYFVVQPMPATLVVKQIVFDGVVMVLLGLLVAFMYRGEGEVRK